MLGVPGPPFGAAMPGGREVTDVVHVAPGDLGTLRSPVLTDVLGRRETHEVGDVVVEGVAVAMVDVAALRDRPVIVAPDRSVQSGLSPLRLPVAGR